MKHEAETNSDKNLSKQFKILNDYAHTEIDRLYCLFDDLDKKILQIQAQKSYQSQYNLNARLDKLERQHMQLPINYDDVEDIKKELQELRKQVKKDNTQTVQNAKKVKEISTEINNSITDEPTANDIRNLQTEVKKLKKHMNSYAPRIQHEISTDDSHNKKRKKTRKTANQIKSKRDIPRPSNKNADSININEILERLNKMQIEISSNADQIKEIKSQIIKNLNYSHDTQNKIDETISNVNQIQTQYQKIEAEIKHLHLKVKNISKKVKKENDSHDNCEKEDKNGNDKNNKKDQVVDENKPSKKHRKTQKPKRKSLKHKKNLDDIDKKEETRKLQQKAKD